MIVLVAGVAGSGKSTIGALLAGSWAGNSRTGTICTQPASIAKMKAGHPLTDEDRRPWLVAVAAWIDQRTAAGRSAVIACSALKRSYRDKLLDGRPELRMVFLEVIDRDALAARLKGRHGHFFRLEMLDSQLAAVEMPAPGERVTVVDDDKPPSRRRAGDHPAAGAGAPFVGCPPVARRHRVLQARPGRVPWRQPGIGDGAMKLKLDLHDIYNRGQDIDRALRAIIDEAVAKKAPVVEIIPGKGSGQLKKRVLRFLDQKEIKALYHRVEKDSKNFGRLFVHFRWR